MQENLIRILQLQWTSARVILVQNFSPRDQAPIMQAFKENSKTKCESDTDAYALIEQELQSKHA